MSDEQLVAVAQRGEREDEVFAILVDRLRPKLHSVLRSMGGKEWDIEEAIQWAWVAAYGRLGRFDPSGKALFSTWLCKVARHHLLHLLRKRRRGRYCVEQMAVLCPSSARGPAEEFWRKRALRLAPKCLCRLSRDQRVAIKLRVMRGLHWQEVARRMGCNVEHCRYLVRCGLRILRGESGNLREPEVG
jgi:RNA polymerase sigma-70 factor (ECF subfamily)